jgi:hypothetical protein
MDRKQIGEIRLNKRTIRIGHQVYPLANISRVQTVRLPWRGKYTTYYPLRGIMVLLLVIGALVAATVAAVPRLELDSDGQQLARQITAIVTALAAIRIVYLLLVLFYRINIRKQYYAMIIETAGTQDTALTGTNRDEIHRIESEIVAAIEDPPSQERVLHISGDVVLGGKTDARGAQGVQVGGGNAQHNAFSGR